MRAGQFGGIEYPDPRARPFAEEQPAHGKAGARQSLEALDSALANSLHDIRQILDPQRTLGVMPVGDFIHLDENSTLRLI